MKKLLLLLLLISFSVTAQIKKGELTYTAINIANDPYASIKEEGINISLELERVQNFGYLKAGIEVFPALEGGYNYLYTAVGFNLKIGYFDNWRLYSGIKAGAVNRRESVYINYGGEAGINYQIYENTLIGLKTDAIYRDDFNYWGGKSKFVGSGYITVTFKL
jgi:hypothetical protein